MPHHGGVTTVHDRRHARSVRGRRPARRRSAVLAAVAVLTVSNVVTQVLWPAGYVPCNLAVAGGLVLLARRCGVTWEDLGLGSARLRRGLLLGGLAAGGVALVYLAALALPAGRAAFVDSRAAVPLAAALFAGLVRVPLGTVLLEEIAFRGVLPALVGGGWWRATLVSSALFGVWHVLPSLGLSSANAAVGATVGAWGQVAHSALAVLATFVAGIALCAWRRCSGHLAAPMLVHVATNSLGVLFAWSVTASG